MTAKIKLTIRGTVYKPGEKITQKLSKAEEKFFLAQGYIENSKETDKEEKIKDNIPAAAVSKNSTAK